MRVITTVPCKVLKRNQWDEMINEARRKIVIRHIGQGFKWSGLSIRGNLSKELKNHFDQEENLKECNEVIRVVKIVPVDMDVGAHTEIVSG